MEITEFKDKKFLSIMGNKFKDYNISGCSDIYRAKVPNDIEVGDIFNIYRGKSTKEGCVWKGDLEKSLNIHVNGVKMNTTELIINKALNIIQNNPFDYSDYDETAGLTLADALTVIVMDGEDHDTELQSDKVYDLIDGEFERMKGNVRYRIADLDHPMYHPDTFDNPEDALKVLDEEYTNRNKGNEYDAYWQNRRTGVQKITTHIEVIYDNKNPKKDA